VEYVTLGPAPHTHDCPDCGKKVIHEGKDCEKFVAKFFRDFPCRKARMKRLEAPAGTCLHCGETDLPAASMSPLSGGEPMRQDDERYKATMVERAIAATAKEGQTAAERNAWKSMNRSERKRAMAGEASGNLF
jgi:hypothetical protein